MSAFLGDRHGGAPVRPSDTKTTTPQMASTPPAAAWRTRRAAAARSPGTVAHSMRATSARTSTCLLLRKGARTAEGRRAIGRPRVGAAEGAGHVGDEA